MAIDEVHDEYRTLGENRLSVVRGKEIVFDFLVAEFSPLVVVGPEKERSDRQVFDRVREGRIGEVGIGFSDDGTGYQEKARESSQQGARDPMRRISFQHWDT